MNNLDNDNILVAQKFRIKTGFRQMNAVVGLKNQAFIIKNSGYYIHLL